MRKAHSSYLVQLNGVRLNEEDIRWPSGSDFCHQIVVGDLVETSYDTGGEVTHINRHSSLELGGLSMPEHFSLVYKDKRGGTCFLNDLVAVDGRILSLFADNTDEVRVVGKCAAPPLPLLF